MFEKASRRQFRFPSSKGLLTVEDLWVIPLQSKSEATVTLDSVAKALHANLKRDDNISFVEPTGAALDRSFTQDKFDLVMHIIKVRVDENKATQTALENKQKKQQILELIKKKEDENLMGSSLEDLRKLADAL